MPIPIQTTNGITKISRSTPVTSTAFAARRLAKQTTLPKERSKAPCANKKESPSPPMINSTDCEKIVFRLYALNSSPLDATPNTATTRIKLTQGKTLTSSFVCAPSKNTVTGSQKMFLSLDLMTCRCPMSLLQSLRLSMFQKSFWVEALFPFCLSRLRPVTRSLRRFVCELAQCWYCGTPYMTCENKAFQKSPV